MGEWITGINRIAEYMEMCPDTLRSYQKIYKMPIVKLGRRWKAIPKDLDDWLRYHYPDQKKRKMMNLSPSQHI